MLDSVLNQINCITLGPKRASFLHDTGTTSLITPWMLVIKWHIKDGQQLVSPLGWSYYIDFIKKKKAVIKGTDEHNITEPHRSGNDWQLSTARVWPWENAATWSGLSLLYTELDKHQSLTFLSGVPATHCLRLHSLISQYVGKILYTARKFFICITRDV